MQASVYGLENTLKSCEAALAAGYVLPADLDAEVRAEAEAYHSDTLAEGINTNDIYETLKLIKISSAYHKDAIAAINITDDDVKSYAQEHINNFRRWKMLCYTVAWEDSDSAAHDDPNVVPLDYETAKAENDKITASTTPRSSPKMFAISC